MWQMNPGRIDATNNWDIANGVLMDPMSQVIVIDMEDDISANPELRNHPRFIGGGCLIPPMEALIAAADGEAQVFKMMYAEHFETPFVDSFVAALIISLINGRQLLLYYSDELGIMETMIDIFWARYGIKIGSVGEHDCEFDPTCIPIWLQYAYQENNIDARSFLFNYPLNVRINYSMMQKLIVDIMPVGSDDEEKAKEIYRMVQLLKETPNLENPIVNPRVG